jgi:hypothetical protein
MKIEILENKDVSNYPNFEPYLAEYREAILSLLNIYYQNIFPERTSKIFRDHIIFESAKNTLYTILSESIKTFCKETQTDSIVYFNENNITNFYNEFLDGYPNKKDYVKILVEITNIITMKLYE